MKLQTTITVILCLIYVQPSDSQPCGLFGCSSGQYCPTGATSCTNCPAGQWQSGTASFSTPNSVCNNDNAGANNIHLYFCC